MALTSGADPIDAGALSIYLAAGALAVAGAVVGVGASYRAVIAAPSGKTVAVVPIGDTVYTNGRAVCGVPVAVRALLTVRT